MQRFLGLFVLAVASLSSPGCCALARWTCGIEAPASPAPYTRDTPREAVRFLFEAVENGRVAEVYESLHPEFREAQGGISLSDLSAAYPRYEDEIRGDVERLREAGLSFGETPEGDVVVWLEADDASLTLVLRDRPLMEVHAESGDDSLDLATELGSLGDTLAVSADAMDVAPVPHDAGVAFPPHLVTRVTLHRDWLILAILDPVNIHLADLFQAETRSESP